MSISAGSLHHKASLQSKSIAADAAGGDAVTWSTSRTLWCHIAEPSGSMALVAAHRNETIKTEITARYNSDITTGKRIVHGGKYYMIEAVLRSGLRNEMMRIIASEGVAT